MGNSTSGFGQSGENDDESEADVSESAMDMAALVDASNVLRTEDVETLFFAYLNHYQAEKKISGLTGKTARILLKDFCELYGLRFRGSNLHVHSREVYSFDEFLSFIFEMQDSIPLSQSLRNRASKYCSLSEGKSFFETVAKPKAFVDEARMIDILPSSCFFPQDETKYFPPSQFREWSLIFAHLKNRDLNMLNLTSRFFRSVLFKYPPDHWRIFRIGTLEQRTADDMGAEITKWQRLRSVVTLEIGVPQLGNMLNNEDLSLILSEMAGLRHLRLLQCHLISEAGFLRSLGTPGFDSLRKLTLWNTRAPLEHITRCPQLAILTLANSELLGPLSLLDHSKSLRRLAIICCWFPGSERPHIRWFQPFFRIENLTHLILVGNAISSNRGVWNSTSFQKEESALLSTLEKLQLYISGPRNSDQMLNLSSACQGLIHRQLTEKDAHSQQWILNETDPEISYGFFV